MKPIRKLPAHTGGGAPIEPRTFSKKKAKAEERPFHHDWRIGIHRHKGELYIKLPGGRAQRAPERLNSHAERK